MDTQQICAANNIVDNIMPSDSTALLVSTDDMSLQSQNNMQVSATTSHEATSAPTELVPSLVNLPTEVLLLIFDHSKMLNRNGNRLGGLPWTVSLGLTNRRLYCILKSLYPDPIYADPMFYPTLAISKQRQSLVRSSLMVMSWQMEGVVGSFLGPEYRPSVLQRARTSCIAFLNRSVYGDGYSLEEEQLGDRWTDNRNHRELPRPYGMGDEWYAHAIEVIRSRRLFLMPLTFDRCYMISYEKIMEMHGSVWDKFAEWRELVNFDMNRPSGVPSKIALNRGVHAWYR